MVGYFCNVLEVHTLHQVTQAVLLDNPAIKGQHGWHDISIGFKPALVKPEIRSSDVGSICICYQQGRDSGSVDVTK